jgi:hypothetical protein
MRGLYFSCYIDNVYFAMPAPRYPVAAADDLLRR